MIFIIRGMRTITPQQKSKWTGYCFFFDKDDERRPPHPFSENILHPPMMVNTHCEEKNETFNLNLNVEEDCVVFEAVQDIGGGETLLVDYGSEYNNELLEERLQSDIQRKLDIASRKNRNHNFKCSKCGHTCHERFRLSHYNKCKLDESKQP